MLVIEKENIWLNQSFKNWEAALNTVGLFLLERGCIREPYIQAMIDRQQLMSVYIGNFVALPHAKAGDEFILKEGVFLIQVPDGVNFGTVDEPKIATLLFIVVMKKQQQLTVLQELSFLCADIDQVMALSDAQTIEEVEELIKRAEIF
ncbi:PTS sugar transporter subunit IIA [Enterococcus ratti]|uniref:Mannitol-specific phosphotransferase enzyme IIA component n=1 Tax=Enterococcus ratti TaxID=150033 RepID=A0A1L8WQB6_9ENTE|nr:PTS sugar transporter subunit IIA [Enterococcus ratti]OJG83012.1 hypothetical protein RV14_GL002015 [Enterococcus ratti]